MVDADVIENVLSRKKELEECLNERQIDLMKKNQMIEQYIYDTYPLLGECVREEMNHEDLSFQIREEFYRQQKTIQEEIIYIQKQQAVIRRIYICFESLPFALKEILEKLCIRQQKWDSVELSRSTISHRKRKAIEQILEWFHSDLTDEEIIQGGQRLMSGLAKNECK